MQMGVMQGIIWDDNPTDSCINPVQITFAANQNGYDQGNIDNVCNFYSYCYYLPQGQGNTCDIKVFSFSFEKL
jgi:hypothetical protein